MASTIDTTPALPTDTCYREAFSSPQTLIAVGGIIGSGKTTLSRDLATKLGYRLVAEPVAENPYLDLFYSDFARYAFPMQMFLLHHRFAQHQGMVWGGESCIQDRSIFEDLCFAHLHNKAGNISDLDFTTYRMAYQNMNNFLHKPDLLIFLDVSVDTAMARIAKRKAEDPRRACERSIDAGYLTALKSEYEDFITSGLGGRIPVLRLDWNVPLTVDEVIAKLHTMVKHKIAM